MNRHFLVNTFRELFGRDPEIETQAPGRVNLIGEHTDYNQGFVLPVNIDRRVCTLAARRKDSRVNVFSLDFNQSSRFNLSEIQRDPQAPWSNYVRGVAAQYQRRGDSPKGMDLLLSGDVPIGAGLSSSAALEVAVAEACRVVSDISVDAVSMAFLCQAAEHEFVGVQCGIMDQFVSAVGKENTALFLDCRDHSYELIPLEVDADIVLCDSGKKRSLENSEYNTRRAECDRAVAILNRLAGDIKALRDVELGQLEQFKDQLPAVNYRRARHVVSENERVREAVRLLRLGDAAGFGQLMYSSHASLRDDYEVSCPELDLLVDLATGLPGMLGARMTGAGFGGCTVNLVRTSAVEEFRACIAYAYEARTGITPRIYVSSPSQGVTHRVLHD